MQKIAPTKRQQEILDFIKKIDDERNCCPRFDEIADNFGLTISAVSAQIINLCAKGHLEKDDNFRGSIKIAK